MRRPGFLLFLLLLLSGYSKAQSNRFTDSIFAIIHAMPDDTAKVRYVNYIYDYELWAFNLPEAYNELKHAVRICKQYNADTLLYATYGSMASFCVRANAHEYALQHRQLMMELAEKWNDSIKIGFLWGAMAASYGALNQHELAIEYFQKAMPFIERSGNIERVGRFNTFIAWEYHKEGMMDSALKYCELGFRQREQAGYVDGMYASGGSLLGMYLAQKNYDSMYVIIDKLVYASDTMRGGNARPGFYSWYSAIHESKGNLDSAYWYIKQFATSAEERHDIHSKMNSYLAMANILEKMNRPAEAFPYLKEHRHLKDSIKNWETNNGLARQREIYDVESKNAEIEKLQQESELQQMNNDKQTRQRTLLLVVLGVTSVLIIISLLAYRQKRKSAAELARQNAVIEEKNRDITDSIVYAQRIQQAILPSMSQIKSALPESFVFFRPKDIVSGDFFWFNETPWSYYLAVVDCTGHGVPGAMMSMIGYNFLGQIVNEQDIEQPAEILNELHRKVLLALNKDMTSHEMKDGMDVGIIRIEKRTGKIYFSGAVRPVYVVSEGELTLVKGDIYSVGGIKDAHAESFSQHEITAAAGSCIYLFSDGMADQFGGPKGKKYKYKQLKELLSKNAALPMTEQLVAVQRSFEEWKGTHEQVDDVCVVGLRVQSQVKE